jgi:hypothetical protein
MNANNLKKVSDEVVVKRQWIAFISCFILFLLASFISAKVFGVAKYSVLGMCIPMWYIGASSIKNRLSIVRLKGQAGYSKGTRAVILGVIMIVVATAYIIIMFTPFISNKFPF